MTRNKMMKYAAVSKMNNVYDEGDVGPGKWAELCFGNANPVTLEIACGKGEYVTGLAKRYPDRNFIGVDIKGDRLYFGARRAYQQNLSNAVFLRTYIQFLDRIFEKGEVSEIWIPFPDPYPRKSKSRKRLSSPFFLNIYRKILAKDGMVHFKTDLDNLFRFTIESLKEEKATIHYLTHDLYSEDETPENAKIITTFEKTFLENDKPIKYVTFSLG